MKYIFIILAVIVSYGFTTVFSGDRYGQNVYMFPDEVINAFQSDCAEKSPVKQSECYYPNQKTPVFRPQKQHYNYPSINQLSKNVAYVSDLYQLNSYKRQIPISRAFPMSSQRYISDTQFKKPTTMDYDFNSHLPSKLLYASDFEPKKYINNNYRYDEHYIQRAQVKYIPVPVYIYKSPESPVGIFSENISYNGYSRAYQLKNYYELANDNLTRHNINFNPYSDMDTLGLNSYDLQKTNNDIFTNNPWSSNSLTDFGVFSSLESLSGEKNLLKGNKYRIFSANDDFYKPAGLLKYNLSDITLFPRTSYLLNP